MSENVIPFTKTDRFSVYRAELGASGEVIEREKVGQAFMKKGAKKFRLKLWLMAGVSYFVAPDDWDDKKYVVLIPDEYKTPTGEMRTTWHRIGHGEVVGSFIKLRIHLLSEDIYLCLFPDKPRAQENRAA